MQDDVKFRDAIVFREIPSADLMPMLAQSKIRKYEDGDLIFTRGDAGDHAYFVVDGLVQISSLSESGKRVTVEIFREQDVFGELAVIDKGARTADAIALGFVKVAAIPAEAFRELLTVRPYSALIYYGWSRRESVARTHFSRMRASLISSIGLPDRSYTWLNSAPPGVRDFGCTRACTRATSRICLALRRGAS